MTSITIDPEVKFFGEQIASTNRRSFSNLIEFLLSREIDEMKKKGYNFMKHNDAAKEYVGGKGKDEKLVQEFERLTKQKQ